MLKKLTPVLYVEAIEPVLPFWEERLGFARTVEVPESDGLGFVALERDGVEIMYQTQTSLEADMPALAGHPTGGALLYLEVEDLDAVEEALGDVARVVPRRTTPYGAQEIVVREPGGSLVAFAQFGE